MTFLGCNLSTICAQNGVTITEHGMYRLTNTTYIVVYSTTNTMELLSLSDALLESAQAKIIIPKTYCDAADIIEWKTHVVAGKNLLVPVITCKSTHTVLSDTNIISYVLDTYQGVADHVWDILYTISLKNKLSLINLMKIYAKSW